MHQHTTYDKLTHPHFKSSSVTGTVMLLVFPMPCLNNAIDASRQIFLRVGNCIDHTRVSVLAFDAFNAK